MLELCTTDEFAAWFNALPARTAEDVATALDVIEQLGAARIAPNSSEFLLWYEHPEMPAGLALREWSEFREVGMYIVEKLSSPRFAHRLSELSPENAKQVAHAVDRVKRMSSVGRRGLLSVLAEFTAAGSARDHADELYRSYQAVLALAGLEATDHRVAKTALRELGLGVDGARLRVLYGLHPGRERGLVILGERLERSFYGDSVRRAERIWQQFLDGNLDTRERAALR